MIIPHIIDQFIWNKIVHEKGAGPKGIKIRQITTKTLEPKILELVDNPTFKKNAEELAGKMKNEDFTEDFYRVITE